MNHRKYIRSFFVWNKFSYVILSSFLLLIALIAYIWWPLLKDYVSYYQKDVPFWQQVDWLLILVFLFMSLLIMINADFKRDFPLAIIALAGGFVIEFWGTRTGLWTYYTYERPPLWIIPAWPIAFLSVNRIVEFFNDMITWKNIKSVFIVYWIIFTGFFIFLIIYTFPTIQNTLTIIVIILCALLIIINPDKQRTIYYFIAGSGLGYFLELWGTTRECWIYYSGEKPPLFTIFAHGFATVSVWLVYRFLINGLRLIHPKDPKTL